MDEIKHKLNTGNSVLVVNAIEKLLLVIKSKYKPAERQKFVIENEDLKFLRQQCSSNDPVVSLTACQGLLALIEDGILEIAHTMSTVVTLLPSAHNYSAIISTMSGLLILDLKSRLQPGQQYTCQFSLKSPQHPFITVLDKKSDAVQDVLTQMQTLCHHPDFIVSSNSLELLRSVFLYLTCNPDRKSSNIRPWQMLLSLQKNSKQPELLLECLSYQQIRNPALVETVLSAYTTVTDVMIYQNNIEYIVALLPTLARIACELVYHGRDPVSCYSLIEKCCDPEMPQLRHVTGLTLSILAQGLGHTCAPHLRHLMALALNIVNNIGCSNISLNIFVAQTLQWLYQPSCLTTNALKLAARIINTYQKEDREDNTLNMPNLYTNKIFRKLLNSDEYISIEYWSHKTWERYKDNPDKLKTWLDCIKQTDIEFQLKMVGFLLGIIMGKSKEIWYEEIILKALEIVVSLTDNKKELCVQLLPVLLYKIANDRSPTVKMECLRAVPHMAKSKENVPIIVSVLTKLKSSKNIPTSFLILLFTSLVETQVRCFPYLQELLVDCTMRHCDSKWELNVAKAMCVKRICEIRPNQGLELVSVISSILNRCTDNSGSIPSSQALRALLCLWRHALLAPPSTWRALEPKLGRDRRSDVVVSIYALLGEVALLHVDTEEYNKLERTCIVTLWSGVAEGDVAEVTAACEGLANYSLEQFQLSDVPEIYRKTVKLPSAYCQTPADAARKPEDVLDYVPCEVWPEIFKYTNQSALTAVRKLCTTYIECEIRGYRSGVYQPEGRGEPHDMTYLSHKSVLRGLAHFLTRQATSPSYDCPDYVLLEILTTLAQDYPKPLPPMDMCFLHSLFDRGNIWKLETLRLAARQANTSGSGRRMIENYLINLEPGDMTDSDQLLIFQILPQLCRTMPPNNLRSPLQKLLAHSYNEISKVKLKNMAEEQIEDLMFIKQLNLIRECFANEKIHEANRTLLAQIIEDYCTEIAEDSVAWPTYKQVWTALPTLHLERSTSPSSWWESSAELLRKAASLRAELLMSQDCSLVWLNEIIDAAQEYVGEHDYILNCIYPVLISAKPNEATKDWILQLMARSQVVFSEPKPDSSKLFLCDVLMLSLICVSGIWSFDDRARDSRETRLVLAPAAVALLCSTGAWKDSVTQMLEWLRHTRNSRDDVISDMCAAAILQLRHHSCFTDAKIWTRVLDRRKN